MLNELSVNKQTRAKQKEHCFLISVVELLLPWLVLSYQYDINEPKLGRDTHNGLWWPVPSSSLTALYLHITQTSYYVFCPEQFCQCQLSCYSFQLKFLPLSNATLYAKFPCFSNKKEILRPGIFMTPPCE
jgi:hypothetical protein